MATRGPSNLPPTIHTTYKMLLGLCIRT